MSACLKFPFSSRVLMRIGMLLGVASLLAACGTTKQLDPAQAAAIKTVGVISVLPSKLVYQKIGITVFNNERVEKPVGTAINDAARAGAEAGLRNLQRVNVKQIEVNVDEVRELFRPGAIVFSWPPDRAREFLVQTAKRHGVDAIVSIREVFDSDNGFAGVRYFLRGGFDSIGVNGIRADTAVSLYDAKGDILISRSAGLGVLYRVDRPDGKAWPYKLEENLDAATHDSVLSAIKQVIGAKASNHVQALGL